MKDTADVLLKDVGGRIKEDGRWPLVVRFRFTARVHADSIDRLILPSVPAYSFGAIAWIRFLIWNWCNNLMQVSWCELCQCMLITWHVLWSAEEISTGCHQVWAPRPSKRTAECWTQVRETICDWYYGCWSLWVHDQFLRRHRTMWASPSDILASALTRTNLVAALYSRLMSKQLIQNENYESLVWLEMKKLWTDMIRFVV